MDEEKVEAKEIAGEYVVVCGGVLAPVGGRSICKITTNKTSGFHAPKSILGTTAELMPLEEFMLAI